MEQLFNVPAEVAKIETKPHNSVRIVFDTRENLTIEQKTLLMGWSNGRNGHLCFLQEREIDAADAIKLPPLEKQEGKKSQSTRLRNVIFLWGKQKGVPNDDDFYNATMENLINQVKEKLN
jgi:hypothetical protein